jgi:hypothetical protein
MVPLMDGLDAKEIRRCSGGGHGAFLLPRLGRRVVRANADGAFTDVPIVNDGIMLDDGARKFEIGIGNTARRV